MGVINSGVMISARKSAAGLNWYKRKGVQCFRAKPQISPDYEPTTAQINQRQLFGTLGLFIKGAPAMRWLVAYGWGGVGSKTGRTKQNNILSELVGRVSRAEDGSRLSAQERAERRDMALNDTARFMSMYCQLTKSYYREIAPSEVVFATNDAVTTVAARYTEASITAYRNYLASLNQDFLNDLQPFGVGMLEGKVINDQTPFNVVLSTVDPGTGDTLVSFEFPTPAIGDRMQISLGFLLYGEIPAGEWQPGAISQHTTYFYNG